MGKVWDMIQDECEENDEEDLLDWISEGEGDPDSVEPPPPQNTSFPATLFISNVPKVAEAKKAKLEGVLKKLIDKWGSNKKTMEINPETGQTDGCMIVEFDDVKSAESAKNAMDGFSLDKLHTFKVIWMDQYEDILNRPERFEPKRTLQQADRRDTREWLQDQKCREQVLLRYQNETEIYWHDMLQGGLQMCYGGQREKAGGKIWCDWLVQWSPQGSFLATFHKQGIALWGGPEFEKKMRLAAQGVKFVEFSPNEEFVLTWTGDPPTEDKTDSVKIFRVLTGELVKKFRTPVVNPIKYLDGNSKDIAEKDFPLFLWSHDGKYIAQCNETTIIVRDTSTFECIKDEEGKDAKLKYDGLSGFQWSPKQNVLAAWIKEKNNNPARLVLVEIPSRTELASRSRTQVEATMYWQSEGDYLCLLATKVSKTGKKGATNMEIFRIREKNMPVDIVEIRETVKGFFWETKGNRFAVLTADEGGQAPKLVLYYIGKEKTEFINAFALPSAGFSHIFWAPYGQYFVCAAVGTRQSAGGGDLLFGGVTPDNKLEILHKDEHFMLTDVQWDPSSRYVLTAVTQPMEAGSMGGYKYAMEAGYAIWTFQGRKLFSQLKEKLYHVSWRPHPPSLLSDRQQADIRKNIKRFSKTYDALDDQAKNSAREKFEAERKAKLDSFKDVLARLSDWAEEREEDTHWQEAYADFCGEQDWEEDERVIEQELSKEEELIAS